MEMVGSVIATTVIFVCVFGFVAYTRYLNYKETIALAEKGLLRQKYARRNGNGKGALRWGIVIGAIGLALIIGLFPISLKENWLLLLIGLLPTFFGLGLVLVYIFTKENGDQPEAAIESDPPVEMLEE